MRLNRSRSDTANNAVAIANPRGPSSSIADELLGVPSSDDVLQFCSEARALRRLSLPSSIFDSP